MSRTEGNTMYPAGYSTTPPMSSSTGASHGRARHPLSPPRRTYSALGGLVGLGLDLSEHVGRRLGLDLADQVLERAGGGAPRLVLRRVELRAGQRVDERGELRL